VWITVLAMAIAVSLEPVRIGLTVLMLNRPRPALQLLAFLCGGFAMGLSVGLVVLFVLRIKLVAATHLTVPRVQVAIGVLALVVSVVLATNLAARLPLPARLVSASARARNLPQGNSLWMAAVLGSGIALPSVDYLAVLAVILASGYSAAVQVGALLMFMVVAFALVEIPLVAFLLAPDATRTRVVALHDWIRSRRRRDVAALLAVAGAVMLGIGIAGL
jgi:hypothetical protein